MKKNHLIIVIFAILISVFSHLHPDLIFLTKLFTEPILIIFNLIVIYLLIVQKKYSKPLMVWLILTYILTFILEAIGTNTGLIFGSYLYGNIFKLQLFNTPILIGLNWIIVCLGSLAIAQRLQTYIFKKPISEIYKNIFLTLSAASIATIFDFFLEPVAIKYEYWNWQNSVIPISNYVTWFIISGFFSLIYLLLKIKINLKWALIWFTIQFIFMIILFGFSL